MKTLVRRQQENLEEAIVKSGEWGMGRSKSVNGICHICGADGPLTYEHVPPRKAFNSQSLIKTPFEKVIGVGLDGKFEGGRIEQRGAGAYTLCNKCNNDTGAWYAEDFIDWSYQAMILMQKSQWNPTLSYPYYLFPLRVIKQVICMFFSLNGPKFHEANPELVRFVKDKEANHLSPRYRVFVGYARGESLRRSGVSSQISIYTGKVIVLSELVFPPFIFVFTFDSPAPDHRLYEITSFSHYRYNDFEIIYPKITVLPTHLWFPGDYRSRAEILADYNRTMEEMARRPCGQPH